MLILLAAGVVILLDQLSKAYIRQNLKPQTSIPIIKGVFHITHVKNTGAAFGLFPNYQLVFLILSLVVIVFILVFLRHTKPKKRLFRLALGLELGGAIGNLIDRAFFGRVTDFLDFRVWPVFNLADCAIVVGLFLLAFILFSSYFKGEESY